MKIFRNQLYIISLGIIAVSCGTPKNNVASTAKSNTPAPKVVNSVKSASEIEQEKPKIETDHGVEFFKSNIADVKKNDNTISYGSIVSAKPYGYKVTKNYFPAVAQNFRQKYIILHYTALNNEKSISVLTQQSVSSHYLVNDLDDIEIYQLVDENKRAYHAGISQWRNDTQLNDTSIGIEIVNGGYKIDSAKNRIFPIFPDAQVKKVAALVKDIALRYNIPPTNILAHSDIAPTRKQDPGPQFPWKKLYDDYQVGMWYDEATKQNFLTQAEGRDFSQEILQPQFIYKLQADLKAFGYGVVPSGTMDDATKKTVEALQFHFRPEKYDGVVDAETWAILQALVQKYSTK